MYYFWKHLVCTFWTCLIHKWCSYFCGVSLPFPFVPPDSNNSPKQPNTASHILIPSGFTFKSMSLKGKTQLKPQGVFSAGYHTVWNEIVYLCKGNWTITINTVYTAISNACPYCTGLMSDSLIYSFLENDLFQHFLWQRFTVGGILTVNDFRVTVSSENTTQTPTGWDQLLP